MAKRKDEQPAQAYFQARDAFDASRKALEQSFVELLTTARMAATAPDVGDLSRRFLADSCAKAERALYGQQE